LGTIQPLTYDINPKLRLNQELDKPLKIVFGLRIGSILKRNAATDGRYVSGHLFIVLFMVVLERETYVFNLVFRLDLENLFCLLNG